VDQYLNNRQNEVLYNLLAEPANNGHSYVADLQSLVTEFPQSGLLRALLAHAEADQNIGHAAVYVNPKALYTLINSPESLAGVAEAQIIQQLDDASHYAKNVEDEHRSNGQETLQLNDFDHTTLEEDAGITEQGALAEIVERFTIAEDMQPENALVEPAGNEVADTEPIVEDDTRLADHYDAEAAEDVEQVEHPIAVQHNEAVDSTEPVYKSIYEEPVVEDEIVEYGPLTDEAVEDEKSETPGPMFEVHEDEPMTETTTFVLAEPLRGIEDEVFDEIVGIESIRFAPIPKPVETVIPDIELPIMDEEASQLVAAEQASEPITQKERALNMDDEAEKLIVGNIAATDYFVFDRAFTERKQAETAETGSGSSIREMEPATETNDISKYDDDSLPYTFLWWLNKTRKEHAGVYQPFKLDTTQAIRQQGADELQQQYYENIFHLNSVEELDRSTALPAVEFDAKRKEDRIIKKFIIEEPHITPPSSDKLDNENKAKKSAEDQDELVTETLARIYTDQMLYHKAINTYKKLILKFPEKSRYFADQIEQLERKTN
jgi:hypothetical protein